MSNRKKRKRTKLSERQLKIRARDHKLRILAGKRLESKIKEAKAAKAAKAEKGRRMRYERAKAAKAAKATESTGIAKNCWKRLPTGCNKKLSETTTPKTWFIDPRQQTAVNCAKRSAAFNRYCGKDDTESQFVVNQPGQPEEAASKAVLLKKYKRKAEKKKKN
jgi:hypothetical protein